MKWNLKRKNIKTTRESSPIEIISVMRQRHSSNVPVMLRRKFQIYNHYPFPSLLIDAQSDANLQSLIDWCNCMKYLWAVQTATTTRSVYFIYPFSNLLILFNRYFSSFFPPNRVVYLFVQNLICPLWSFFLLFLVSLILTFSGQRLSSIIHINTVIISRIASISNIC